MVFIVGDVSGKGVAASLLMSHLHALFNALVDVGLPVGELVRISDQREHSFRLKVNTHFGRR